MALPSITQMVEDRVEILGFGETLIERFKTEAFYYIQPYTNKTDDEVEDESSYSNLQRILIADLTAYKCFSKAIKDISSKHTATDADGSVNTGKRLKKAKADVVESEFEYDKSAKLEIQSLYSACKRNVCDTAFNLNYPLPMCFANLEIKDDSAHCPFIFVPSNC